MSDPTAPDPGAPSTAMVLAGTDVPDDLDKQMRLADVVSQAVGVLPRHLSGKPGNVLAVMIAARALNLPMWQAFQHLTPIEGKMSMSADLQRAIVTRHGCVVKTIESTAQSATVTLTRPDQPGEVHSCTWTIEDAKTAELTGKDNWRHHPKAMLVARATTTLLRQNASDLLLGFVYNPDELRDAVGIIDVTDSAVVREVEAVRLTAEQQAEWRARIADAADEGALRAVWDEAVKAGARDSYLDPVGDAPGDSVKTLVNKRLGELRAEPAEADPPNGDVLDPDDPPAAGGVVEGEVVDAELVEEPFADPAHPPTVTEQVQRMACGCDAEVVFATGAHEPGCPQA